MAASDKLFETNEEELSDRHVFRYNYYVRNLTGIQRWPFTRCFQTKCQVLLTSWQFEMLFQQVPGSGVVSCSITLKRIDKVNIPVMASLLVSLSRDALDNSFISEKFAKKGILPGDEINKSIPEVIPIEHMRTTYYQKIDIAVTIMIRNCHSKIKTDLERNLRHMKL
ncbi:hypothetical protein HNY73_010696 [Argiope bruennichi]|uniref:Uncharacterized protein n=1 Tax=Argiope bruennichi TaxID=94029 RepID=A0A8T0F6Q7_ARGBR|nr:hypothetical protein HNY73_010696 [Argiope bruennichi]